ncbi:type II toxin-antitoxin system RatA family toxin [Streptomyces virginiae]|uniref:type II toxin-antitoxin system RatA family toxin n=1 Tax=Streptomyces virginiae TaxID=1961 RepID=UPI002259ABD8|nr:SRPBCC family protein [Streptomyces virginiae]MCX4960136.1 SRPBCC family protein [Streptomyces virginiae]
MRSVAVEHRSAGVDARTAYELVRDFARYPRLVPIVRRVDVAPAGPGGAVISDWEVDFRNGVLAWTEEDVFDDTAMGISFRQTEGDFETFDGRWAITPQDENEDGDGDGGGAGCTVRFEAEFDFGLPSLSQIIDPVAERVLRETIETILRALLDTNTVVGASADTGAGTGVGVGVGAGVEGV